MRQLIVISGAECFDGEIALINSLFEAGMELFHFRKPGISSTSCDAFLNGISPEYHDKLVLHQFHELGKQNGFHRFHFSEAKRESQDAREGKYILSTSVHSLAKYHELKEFEYAFFGPMFDSISKPGYKGSGTDFILPEDMRGKLVALGGITQYNIEQVFEMGFSKVAILGVLWNNPPKALDTFKQISKLCR